MNRSSEFRPYTVFTVGGCEYRLRINTQSAIDAEKQLGTSISRAWTRLDEVFVQTVILRAALRGFDDAADMEKAAALRDSFIENGGNMDGLMETIREVYICSGFMKRKTTQEASEEEKSSEKVSRKS